MAEINVKEAVKAAKDALLELYEDDPPKAMAFEEIEMIKDSGRELWAVTLGFLRHNGVVMQTPNAIGAIFNPAPSQIEHRVYKTVFIDAASGQFVKMAHYAACTGGDEQFGQADLVQAHTLLLTDDLDLYVSAVSAGGDAINFTHMREAADTV